MFPWIDSLHLCLAVTPLALYLLVIGWLNLRPRMTMVTGFTDTLLLGMGVSGLVLMGPAELFFPEVAAFRMGTWVWLLLGALYAFFVLLLALSQRPRLVFYNADLTAVNALTEQVARQVDASTTQLGDYLLLPHRGLQLHAAQSPVFRNVQLESLGESHDLGGWLALRRHLAAAGDDQIVAPARTGFVLVGLAALFLVMLAALSIADQHEMARAIDELLRRD